MTNYEKVEKLLDDYREIDINIKGIEIEMKIEGVKGISYNDMPGSPISSNKSSVESELMKVNKLKNERIYLEIKKEAIENMFRILDDTDLKLIKYRYINKLSFKEISNKLNLNDNYLIAKRNQIINKKLIPYAERYKLI